MNLYNLQNQFDCSFTHFRLMDLLLKHDFVQQYDINDFPMTKEYPNFFSELSKKDFDWIWKNPTKKWSKNNPAIAYWDKKSNKIFVDFGSEFYTKNKDEVIKKSPLDFGYLIIQEGSRQNDKSIVYDWTAFMINYLLAWFSTNQSTNELKTNYFSEIRNAIHKFDFSNYKALHEGLDINNIPEYWLKEMSEKQKELIRFINQK